MTDDSIARSYAQEEIRKKRKGRTPEQLAALASGMVRHLAVEQEEWSKLVTECARSMHAEGKTMQQIGDVLGVTRQRASQIVGR
jgi:DNA-directed RNA polymerase specialized sigma subunit